MQSKRIKSFLGAWCIVLLAVAMVVSVIGFLPRSSAAPAEAATSILTVHKVFLTDKSSSSTVDPSKFWHIADSAEAVAQDDFVILDTTLQQRTIDDETIYGREAIAIYFGGSPTSKGIPSVSIRYNNNLLQINEVVELDDQDETTGQCTFSQYLFALTPAEVAAGNLNDCYTTRYSDGSEVAAPEGMYTVTLVYFDTVLGQQTEKISFYLTTQKTYNVVNENPTFGDTEKVEAATDDLPATNIKNQMTATLNYFNFNNVATTYYDSKQGNFFTRANADRLYYPTLIYNPEKFDISFTRTLYNYRETVSTSFSVYRLTQNGTTREIGYLDVSTYTTDDPTRIIRRTYTIEPDTDGTYSIKIQFDQVGEYDITKTPKLKTGYVGVKVNFVTPTANIITANSKYLNPLKLVINGYVANYSDTATTSAPLYDDTYSYGSMASTDINKTDDVVYAHDFVTASDSQVISNTERTRAETIYTADMTFANTNFVTNTGDTAASTGASIITTSKLGSLISSWLGSGSNTDSALSKFFEYNASTGYISTSKTVERESATYYTVMASTNLAPVTFDFYGKLYTGSSTQYASWYAYQDFFGNGSVNKYTRGMSFSEPGRYIVYLTYENVIYSANYQSGSRQHQYMHQIFCFEITNSTPTISIYSQDDTLAPTIQATEYSQSLSIDSYTNGYVFASWEAAGPFDAEIYCTYNVYDWAGNVLSEKNSLNGLVYQKNKNSGIKYAVSTQTADLLYGSRKIKGGAYGQDGYYQIQVFRSNNPRAFVNYTFSIDTAPIDGIKALKVVGQSIAQDTGSTEPVVLSELDYSDSSKFNLITQWAFGYTWQDKQSGAEITAQYVYASISKTTNFDLVAAITNSSSASLSSAKDTLLSAAASGHVYMPTNASLGVFTPAMSYTKIDPKTTGNLLASQIINTPQLAFLLLRDSANNTAIFVTMLDTTDTQVLQVEKQASYVNVITKDTSFFWGTHKSIKANQSTASKTPGTIYDVYDLVNTFDTETKTYAWTLNGQTYTSHTSIAKVLTDMDLNSTRAINIPLSEVTFGAADGADTTVTPTSSQNGASAKNWYGTIRVIPGATEDDEYQTGVTIDGGLLTAANTHTLQNGEFRYQITVWDSAGNDNAGGLNVEVNLDKSLGSLRSYYNFDGTDLSYNRNYDQGITDRQYVANTYSTNRRYVAFSWTEPGGAFKIKDIVLEFYAFSNKLDSDNYPYSDTPAKTITLYSSEQGTDATYDDGTLYKISYGGSGSTTLYYQTSILCKLIYSAEFAGAASEAGKYVITRTYQESAQQADLEGDKMQKTYTYYIDRNAILPTSTYEYGDEKLQFGYHQGDYLYYPTYPESGSITFDNYGLLTNTEKFDNLSFDTQNLTATTPNNVIVRSNIMPASVSMTTWTSGGYTVYDKYYSAPSDTSSDPTAAFERIQSILEQYKNSTRLQVAVQFFANTSTGGYVFKNQTMYSTKTTARSGSDPDTLSRPLSDLQYAFKKVGKYRVFLFDLSNFDGLLTGKAYTDFKKISYPLSNSQNITQNTLYPNCSIINFELTGTSPTFSFQAGLNDDSYGPLTSQTTEQLTSFTKARITWSDPSDIYTAQNAYNEISITKTIIPKGNNTSAATPAPTTYKKYFNQISKTLTSVFQDPIELTSQTDVADELVADGYIRVELNDAKIQQLLTSGLDSLTEYIESLTEIPAAPGTYYPYFIYVSDEQYITTITNNGIASTDLNQIEYYKVRKSASSKTYNYYLLLPQAELEDAAKNSQKQVDTRYTVTIHYIAKDRADYVYTEADGTTTVSYYQTTQELYQDYTAPYYNLVDLIEADAFINSLGTSFKNNLIANIDNPEYTFLKSYAFAVEPGFSIPYRNKYESSSYYYYYQHENYTGYKRNQVVTAADGRYPGAPRFVKTDTTHFHKAAYSAAPGITKYHTFTEPGYYDIIEQDTAGNYRVYTIYVTDDTYTLRATNQGLTIAVDKTTIAGQVYNSGKYSVYNSSGFTITAFDSSDLWQRITLQNMMDTSESLECYLVPQDAANEISAIFNAQNVYVCSTIDDLLAKINEFLTDTAIANDETADGYGSQIKVSIDDRLAAAGSKSFFVNTPGKMLINSEQDFLSLITMNTQNNQFVLKMPNTLGILSTKLTSLEVYLIESDQSTIPISTDSNYIPLPTTQEDFESSWSIDTGYSFSLTNNTVYKFVFADNFGRTATYSYPIDSSLTRELHFSGNTKSYTWTDGNTYTFTSNDVDFVYQSTGLYVSIDIIDLDTGKTLYSKDYGDLIDTENKYFSYIRDSLSANIVTIRFLATRGYNNLVTIKINNDINNSTDVLSSYSFVLYTIFPQIILSDTHGSPIQNYLTSKEVMLTWQPVEAMFAPYVELIYPDGTVATITSGFTVEAEGVYTVRCANDIGPYYSGQIVFTIQEYLISIYGVYQITTSGQTVQLHAFTDSYKYTTLAGRELAISQYMFLSNDTSWERNISVICNEDKDLELDVVETFGNTRIYLVHGKDKGLFQLEIYFAVTRIPSLNVSNFTNFRINGDSTTRVDDFETTDTVITWNTTYTDNSATGRTVSYIEFFGLDLSYNGTHVGTYTSGSITLTNSGIYTITISDPVGQKHYFGANANSTTFTLTILTNVIYNVNDNAAIPYATYSDTVDFFVPELSYYDYTPVVTVYRNNSLYTITPNASGHYIFSTPGTYKIVIKTSIERVIGTVPAAQLEAVYQFNIVSPNEAISSFDFAPIAGYEIIDVIRLDNDTNITAEVRGENAKITTLHITPKDLGIGKYQITVQVQANGYSPSQTYTFSVWVNDETVIITPSREWGSGSTSGFNLTINTASVYERIGECHIMINGAIALSIGESNKDLVDPTVLGDYTDQGDYIIQLVSASGTVLQSYRLTIYEPLNTAAIILICVAVGVVVILTILFIIMRKKVKVR